MVSEQGIDDLAANLKPFQTATLVFHGSEGFDRNTDSLKAVLADRQKSSELILFVDWSKHSVNRLTASYQGQRVGKKFANKLDIKAKHLHIIGISVGAFAANAYVEQIKKFHQEARVKLTLLDPFVAKGLDFSYGIRVFGKNADVCQQFLNTDDPVPFTNKPLSSCSVIDVTSLRPEDVAGHDWPLVYYTKLIENFDLRAIATLS